MGSVAPRIRSGDIPSMHRMARGGYGLRPMSYSMLLHVLLGVPSTGPRQSGK